MEDTVDEFWEKRGKGNEKVMDFGRKNINRFLNLDTNVYREGKLSKKTKELLGLVSSLVLRCDDCIKYHLVQCKKEEITKEEIREALSIGLVVGGSITIPHLRKAVDFWEKLENKNLKEW